MLLELDKAGQAAHIPEPQDFAGKPEAERVVTGNRKRVASAEGC